MNEDGIQNQKQTKKTAKSFTEDEELISSGFEYATERDSVKIYRKRK